jgi:hypothetical protein
MHLQKEISKKTLEKKTFFVVILSATDENSRIQSRIFKSVGQIRGSGCHGSTTLFNGRRVRSILDFDNDKVIDYCYSALDTALSFSGI